MLASSGPFHEAFGCDGRLGWRGLATPAMGRAIIHSTRRRGRLLNRWPERERSTGYREIDLGARWCDRIGVAGFEIVDDVDVACSRLIREDSPIESIPGDLTDVEARCLIRHDFLDVVGFETSVVELLEHRPLRAENWQRRIALEVRHRRDRVDLLNKRYINLSCDSWCTFVREV